MSNDGHRYQVTRLGSVLVGKLHAITHSLETSDTSARSWIDATIDAHMRDAVRIDLDDRGP